MIDADVRKREVVSHMQDKADMGMEVETQVFLRTSFMDDPIGRAPSSQCCLHQRFSTSGTRTPRGTPAVAKGYAGKNIVAKYVIS